VALLVDDNDLYSPPTSRSRHHSERVAAWDPSRQELTVSHIAPPDPITLAKADGAVLRKSMHACDMLGAC
jgi:hypothetical protein